MGTRTSPLAPTPRAPNAAHRAASAARGSLAVVAAVASAVAVCAWQGACGAASGRGAPPAATTGALAGTVRDADGPLSLVLVVALHERGSTRASEVTGADGRYRIDELPPGRYRVIAYHGGHTAQLLAVVVAAGRLTRGDLDVVPGRDTHAVATAPARRTSAGHSPAPEPSGPKQPIGPNGPDQVSDSRTEQPRPATGHDPTTSPRPGKRPGVTGTIRGTVIDRFSRAAVSGAVITVLRSRAPDTSARFAMSDDSGQFRVPGLRPGVYELSVYYHLMTRGSIEVRRGNIAVEAGETTTLELSLDVQTHP